jgi:hypothetical protein
MGQANRRGTFEQRVDQAQLAQQIIDKALTDKKVAALILTQKFNGNRNAFANDIVRRAIERMNQEKASLDHSSKIPDTSGD